MAQFHLQQRTGEIVKIFPKASDIFKQRKIGFCCSGDRPLKEAVTENSLDGEIILKELNTAYEDWQNKDRETFDWNRISLFEWINHIQERFHKPLPDELLGIYSLVIKVYQVHGDSYEPLNDLFKIYSEFQTKLLKHTTEKDHYLYPSIISNEKSQQELPDQKLLKELRKLKKKHTKLKDFLENIRHVTNHFTPPKGACATFQLTYARLAELNEEISKYIEREKDMIEQRFSI